MFINGTVNLLLFYFSIDKLKFQISLLVSIPPQDQILLIGPPYRILDGVVSFLSWCRSMVSNLPVFVVQHEHACGGEAHFRV